MAKSKWVASKASQPMTNAAYTSIRILSDLVNGKLTVQEADRELWVECGIATQQVVDSKGNAIRLRILPDTTTIRYAETLEIGPLGPKV